jgi:hypothetical protein
VLFRFQSSPGPQAGRNNPTIAVNIGAISPWFQSAPGLQTRRNPSGKGSASDGYPDISILTRPEDRAQHPVEELISIPNDEFQSSPSPKAGRNDRLRTFTCASPS